MDNTGVENRSVKNEFKYKKWMHTSPSFLLQIIAMNRLGTDEMQTCL